MLAFFKESLRSSKDTRLQWMFFADDSSDSSSDDLPSYHEEERITPNICSEYQNLFKSEIPSTPWSQIADKFRKCLFTNLNSSAIVEFLDSLLTFIRKGPKDSRKFTRQICNYLFATKSLASNVAVDESYYDHLRKILVLYCILELRMVSCIYDDSTVASDIFLKISLLMQGSNAITVIDVLIDIGEQIRSARSTAIMMIVYRKFLTKTLVGGPVELDDDSFVKHLIVFYSWYKAENINEKATVVKFFLSTVKPSQGLRSNPVYSPFLQPYNPDESGDYKKLLQHPFQQKALVMALRDTDIITNFQNDCQKTIFLDLTLDEEPVNVKTEPLDLSLNLPNEIINVDDDVDCMEISYLPKLFERLDDLNISEKRLMAQRNVQMNTVEIIGSDSDIETNEVDEINTSLTVMSDANFGVTNSNNDSNLSNVSTPSLDDMYRRNSSNLKTYSRKKDRISLSQPTFLQTHRRITLPNNQSIQEQIANKIPPILRSRSFTNTPFGKSKKVTFHDPPATTYVFERCNYDKSSGNNHNEDNNSEISSDYIVTGPQCNFPYVSSGVLRYTSPNSSTQTETVDVPRVAPVSRSRKRKRSLNNSKQKRTSIDSWVKRKKVFVNANETHSTTHNKTQKTPKNKKVAASTTDLTILSTQLNRCYVRLRRCVELPPMELPPIKRVSVNLGRDNMSAEKMRQMSFDEDMTLKEMLEAKERMLSNSTSLGTKGDFENHVRGSESRTSSLSNYQFISPLVASKNFVIDQSIFESTVAHPKKSFYIQSKFNVSKSKSVILKIKTKPDKRKAPSLKVMRKQSNIHQSFVIKDQTVIRKAKVVDPHFTNCFVSLKKLRGFLLGPTSNNSTKNPRRPQHNVNNDIICRLPTKSPQEYQFKRSFEKMPVAENTSMMHSNVELSQISLYTSSPIISSVTSISSEQIAANDRINEPPQSILHELDATSNLPQLEITLETSNIERTMLTNQNMESISENESSSPALTPAESTTEVNHCQTLSSINCMKIVREVTSCSPDTTTSSAPQYLLMSDAYSPSPETNAEMENDVHVTTNAINCDMSSEKRLRMVYDDCDTDIPSPVYSPYEGRKKHFRNENSLKSNLAMLDTSQVVNGCKDICDAVTPIDLTLKITSNDMELNNIIMNAGETPM